jgi:hypothetical protein
LKPAVDAVFEKIQGLRIGPQTVRMRICRGVEHADGKDRTEIVSLCCGDGQVWVPGRFDLRLMSGDLLPEGLVVHVSMLAWNRDIMTANEPSR